MKIGVPYIDGTGQFGCNYYEDSLACCDTAQCKPAVPCRESWECKNEEKEQNMRYDTNMNLTVAAPSVIDPDQNAREYLDQRVTSILWAKDQELRNTYGLTDDPTPTTAKEFVKRIQDGKFVIKMDVYSGKYGSIVFRDPAKKEDNEGYAAAEKLLSAAYQKAKDEVMVMFPEAALESVRAFEAATFPLIVSEVAH